MISQGIPISSREPLAEMIVNNNSLNHDELTVLADTVYYQHCASTPRTELGPVDTLYSHNGMEGQQTDTDTDTVDFLVSILQLIAQDTNNVLRYAEQVGRDNNLRDTIQPLAYIDPLPDYFSLLEQARQCRHGDQGLHNPIRKFICYVYALIDRNATLERELQRQTKSYKRSY